MSHIIARCLVSILPSNEVKRMSNVEDITIKGGFTGQEGYPWYLSEDVKRPFMELKLS